MYKIKSLSLKLLVFFVFAAFVLAGSPVFANPGGKLKNSRVLVYTKNGKGYVHDNIPSAVACIKDLAAANSFNIDVSDDD